MSNIYNNNYKSNNQHRYDFFGRHTKLFSLKLRYMGGMKLEYGAKLLALMTILSIVRIPIAEVEALKAQPLWEIFYILLIAWCVFWFLDGFVGHFLDGFLGGVQDFDLGMIYFLIEGTKKKGFKNTRLDILRTVSFEIYMRRHPAFRREYEDIKRTYDCYAKGWYDTKTVVIRNHMLAELYKREGIYLVNGWKVRSSKNR